MGIPADAFLTKTDEQRFAETAKSSGRFEELMCRTAIKGKSELARPRRNRARATSHSSSYPTQKDNRFQSSPAWSFGGRHSDEIDTLASNNNFYLFGTHRCPQGEELLTDLRCRDAVAQDALDKVGRQWKSVPGPGTYRSPSCVGDPMSKGARDPTDVKVGEVNMGKTPSWGMGMTSRRVKPYHTLGDRPLVQHEGILRPPTPCAKKTIWGPPCSEKGVVPGPGTYFTRCHSAPSAFSDFQRPQMTAM